MSQVKILTSPSCSYCHAAKNLLNHHFIDFQEIDLINDQEYAQNLLTQSGQRTVPQIFINDKPIGGFTELAQMLNKENFDSSQLDTL